MKKITALVMMMCLVVLPLTACTANNPTTTTTTTTRAATTTTTTVADTVDTTTSDTAETTSAATDAGMNAEGNLTRYLHGKIETVTDNGMTLTDVPVYGTCQIEVDASTQLVGVSELSELEQNFHVIVGYAAPNTGVGILPDNGSLMEGVSEAASEIMTILPDASDVADAVDGADASPKPSATPDSHSQASPSTNNGMNMGEKLVAVTVEVAEPLPTLSGNITTINADGFIMEGTSEGTVHVVATEGTLMEGMDKPAEGDTVTVVYNGQIGKMNPARVTAVSVTKDEKAPK